MVWTAWYHKRRQHAGRIDQCQACSDVFDFLITLVISGAGELVAKKELE